MATYHGMTFIECLGCGYRTEDDFTMEVWNDQLLACPNCEACEDIRWGSDGEVWEKVGDNRYQVKTEEAPR